MRILSTARTLSPVVAMVIAFAGLGAWFVGGPARPDSTAGYPLPSSVPPPDSRAADLDLALAEASAVGSGGAPVGAVQPARDSPSASVAIVHVAAWTGIPERALVAYASAVRELADADPGCGIAWSQLAAVADVESGHGTSHGARATADGRVSPAILGPALDGNEYQLVPDSDGGVLDGDTATDRAVGPFQFIPQTWLRWASDADGDGLADPQDLDDAALAAARYLCSYGDLRDPSVWADAVFGYNHDDTYVDRVTRRVLEIEAALP